MISLWFTFYFRGNSNYRLYLFNSICVFLSQFYSAVLCVFGSIVKHHIRLHPLNVNAYWVILTAAFICSESVLCFAFIFYLFVVLLRLCADLKAELCGFFSADVLILIVTFVVVMRWWCGGGGGDRDSRFTLLLCFVILSWLLSLLFCYYNLLLLRILVMVLLLMFWWHH